MQIAELRSELNLSLEQFAERVGLASRGRMSVIERENRCALSVALRIEELSGGRIDAAELCNDVRAARLALIQGGLGDTEDRQILCDPCGRRVDGEVAVDCIAVDCPHSQRDAA